MIIELKAQRFYCLDKTKSSKNTEIRKTLSGLQMATNQLRETFSTHLCGFTARVAKGSECERPRNKRKTTPPKKPGESVYYQVKYSLDKLH